MIEDLSLSLLMAASLDASQVELMLPRVSFGPLPLYRSSFLSPFPGSIGAVHWLSSRPVGSYQNVLEVRGSIAVSQRLWEEAFVVNELGMIRIIAASKYITLVTAEPLGTNGADHEIGLAQTIITSAARLVNSV
jgi:hypothetical protein